MIKTKQDIHVDFLRNFTRYFESNLIRLPGHSAKLHAILVDFKKWESDNHVDDLGRFGATKKRIRAFLQRRGFDFGRTTEGSPTVLGLGIKIQPDAW